MSDINTGEGELCEESDITNDEKMQTLMYVFWLVLVLRTTPTCYSILTPENPNNPVTT